MRVGGLPVQLTLQSGAFPVIMNTPPSAAALRDDATLEDLQVVLDLVGVSAEAVEEVVVSHGVGRQRRLGGRQAADGVARDAQQLHLERTREREAKEERSETTSGSIAYFKPRQLSDNEEEVDEGEVREALGGDVDLEEHRGRSNNLVKTLNSEDRSSGPGSSPPHLVERVVDAGRLQVGGDVVQQSVVLFRVGQRRVLVVGFNVGQQRPGHVTEGDISWCCNQETSSVVDQQSCTWTVGAPDLLGLGRGAGVHFAGVPCCTTTTHDGSSGHGEALKAFLNRHIPTTPCTGVTTASSTFRTSTTARSFRTVLWIHTRKF
ncbi:hypothetical protein EYF80_016808 [Liparis tanakae]|uniref:Uncharacterized protein n=1 Tax=Liparis tanakae TaxID=230148 RepID=A0A4Z2I482_9TELE|nr:hypothetical protein EYF80_016808 [Liparis tanakae]